VKRFFGFSAAQKAQGDVGEAILGLSEKAGCLARGTLRGAHLIKVD
jgi:hypothetical protein